MTPVDEAADAGRARDSTGGRGLRLVVWDDTGLGRAPWQPLLTTSWRLGSRWYRHRGHAPVDAAFGARSWTEAFAWLCSVQPHAAIAEVQFWGHGLFGRVFLGGAVLDEHTIRPGGTHHEDLVALRARLTTSGSLLWLRTCSAFGGRRGHRFATTLAEAVGCRVAGHTHVIGPLQSGLHSVRPGAAPTWPADEGVDDGDEDRAALPSTPFAVNTITCLHGRIPPGW